MTQSVKVADATEEAIFEAAKELGIPVEAVTWGVIKQVRRGLKLLSAEGSHKPSIEEAIIWAFNK